MTEPAKPTPTDQGRKRDLATIHVAKKQLGMDDDTYRSMLWAVGRVKSAGDLDFAGRRAVLDHLKACGFRHHRPQAQDPQSRKIRALWLELKALGALRDSSEEALAAYAERVTGVQALQWLSSDQASQVIEQLKAWRRRLAQEARTLALKEGEAACRR
ncbi:MAG: regulatory protein GemA [Burkholderiales bacterium]|nr:regulatory protein GemA [Burkholderiales bacterium]